jgi:pimeloyl-ACP methyl ester carboxylesterase
MRKIQLHGNDITYFDEGSGEPLVFMHGFPLDHTMWQPHLDDLARNFRVIAPDLRSLGSSLSAATVVTMLDHAHDIAALLNHLEIKDPVNFIGLSMGGYVLWQIKEHYPQLIKRAIICDTKITADSDEAKAVRKTTADRVIKEGTKFLVESMLPKLVHVETLKHRPLVKQSIEKMIIHAPPAGVAACSLGMADRPDMSHLLQEFHQPTLVICGEDDAITPAAGMLEMSQQMPHSNFKIIPNAGHMSPLEQPAIFQQLLLEFLSFSSH